jgi:hypothetical protein
VDEFPDTANTNHVAHPPVLPNLNVGVNFVGTIDRWDYYWEELGHG